MKVLENIPPGTKKLFVTYLFIFTFGGFFLSGFYFSNQETSLIGDDYTTLAPLLVVENGTVREEVTIHTGSIISTDVPKNLEGPKNSEVVVVDTSQIISTSEVVTVETVTDIEESSLNSAPKKNRTPVETVDQSTPNTVSSEPPRYEFRLYASLSQATRLRRLLEKVVISNTFHDKVTPLAVEIVDDRTEPRGRMTMDSVSLIVSIPSESESIRVFVHELGHVIDIHYLKENVFGNDISEDFYKISWKDHQTKKPGQSYENFVSGYAMTNKYEDFAESFSEYVFANEHFKSIAQKNSVLQKKYDFFKKKLFQDEEFIGTDFEMNDRKTYIWDTTKMTIAVNKYLYYIK